MAKAPKAPKPTASQLATERRQQIELDKEVEEQESRATAIARGKLGSASLLAGIGGRSGGGQAKSQAAPTPSGPAGQFAGLRNLFGGR